MPHRLDHLSRFRTLARQRPPRMVVVFAWMTGVAIAVSAFILFGVPWVQTAPGPGQVVALDPSERPQDVTALVGGRIERWYVQDGQQVAQGAPVARVIDVDPTLLSRLAAERAQVEAEIAAIRRSQSVAAIDVARTGQLLAEGLASRRDHEQAQIRVADAAARLAEARAKLNRINVQLNRSSAQIVAAPRAGRVQNVNAAAGGALVSAGTVLATIAPERAERAVELFIDGRDVPLVRAGRRVRLEFEGWPAIQFSGWPAVARGLFDGRVRALDPTARPSGLFRVLVEPIPGEHPWPDLQYARLGGKVQGWVQGETVTVGYELWRLLNDFPLDFGERNAPSAAPTGSASGASADAAGAGNAP